MNRLAKILALLLAVVWLPVVTHCDLGNLPGLEFLACCDQPDTLCHQNEDCQQDACGVVESGTYKAEEQLASAPALRLLTVFLPPALSVVRETYRANPVAVSPTPPVIPRPWQFSLRTARPPRAPSLFA